MVASEARRFMRKARCSFCGNWTSYNDSGTNCTSDTQHRTAYLAYVSPEMQSDAIMKTEQGIIKEDRISLLEDAVKEGDGVLALQPPKYPLRSLSFLYSAVLPSLNRKQ